MVGRGRCGHWQVCFDAFVMGFPKNRVLAVCRVFAAILGFLKIWNAKADSSRRLPAAGRRAVQNRFTRGASNSS
jgi:hypothetical protein